MTLTAEEKTALAWLVAALRPSLDRELKPLPPLGATIRDIQTVVSDYHGIELDDLLSDDRHRRLARPRQIAMYLSRMLTRQSLQSIGRSFNRDHTTILHAVKQIAGLIYYDPELRLSLERCQERIKALVARRIQIYNGGTHAPQV